MACRCFIRSSALRKMLREVEGSVYAALREHRLKGSVAGVVESLATGACSKRFGREATSDGYLRNQASWRRGTICERIMNVAAFPAGL